MSSRYPHSGKTKKSSRYYNTPTNPHIRSLDLALVRYSKQKGSFASGNSKYLKDESIKVKNLLDLVIADMPNSKINDAIREKRRRYQDEIEAIKKSAYERIQVEQKKQGLSAIFSIITGKTIQSNEAKSRIDQIQKLIWNTEMSPVTFTDYRYEVLRNKADSLIKYLELIKKSIQPAIASEIQRAATKEKMAEKRIDDEQKRVQREARTKALAAAHMGNSRALADSVKRSIRRQLKLINHCPYCEGDIGPDPEADHIYPIALGGLSTKENMVYICKPCNSKKGKKTLREFVKLMKYDMDRVDYLLNKLGKSF
jgi:5-methylcytosine-specific restriction endonuclease McrA